MPSPRFIPTLVHGVHILEGRLQISDSLRGQLKGLLALTDDPRAQLQHLRWTVALLDEAGTLVAPADRRMLQAARQLAAAIEEELPYEAAETAPGMQRALPAEFEFLRQAGARMHAS